METPALDIILTTLRGGMNDTDPAMMLPADQCVSATNVEFFSSTLGERRGGTVASSIAGAGFSTLNRIVHLSEWFPTGDVASPEGWAVAATSGSSVAWARHTTSPSQWNVVTPSDAMLTASPGIYQITTQPLASAIPLKFFAYPTGTDRLYVWDSDSLTLRRSGLAQPAAPTVADTGSGTFATVRYYRVRYIQRKVGTTTIIRRSEPSSSLTFTPSGSGSGALVTMPALLSEGETHWELEASTDNATFYLLATTTVATTTYTDTTVYATGYSAGTLSEKIGEYLVWSAVKYLAVDGDRLVGAGHFTDSTRASTIYWTLDYLAPGVGNAERLPLSINTSINLDNGDGGPITGVGSGVYGTWYAFKWSRVYAMVRTSNATTAYEVLTISTDIGAIPGSVFPGDDESGSPCLYFLDPMTGPCRIGPQGLQQLYGLRTTWKRINLAAALPACGCHYPYKHQALWWIAVDNNSTPNLKLTLQISELQALNGKQVGRGWSLGTGTGALALCAAALTETAFVSNTISLNRRPSIGQVAPQYIQRTDLGSFDNGNTYTASITSRPFTVHGLLGVFGAMSAVLLANADPNTTVKVTLIRDFGAESVSATTPIAAVGTETLVIKLLDSLALSGATILQVQFSDP